MKTGGGSTPQTPGKALGIGPLGPQGPRATHPRGPGALGALSVLLRCGAAPPVQFTLVELSGDKRKLQQIVWNWPMWVWTED